ncbi:MULTISPECIES: hypothetical protein [Myxococcus]|nr:MULTISPECIES: hypothetical protein [Myxococcus]QZZ53031.1 hypothetical protein MyxoNM_27835 [Myxococcus xanthus]UYI12722.1 hypothetical protein N3T43_27145 [Myxococcus xanthus]UYI20089.1 hypothetical protein N1129_27595 [Myxococcus xanthus]SDY06297.1 hypothetical protein SAMN05444383_117152 [Myxococcus xanthus]
MRVLPARLGAILLTFLPLIALADAPRDRFGAAGYFRIMTRPDFAGGSGQLGYYWLYGRLLNESPYGELNLRLDALQATPGTDEVWAEVHSRISGRSFRSADPGNGSLVNFSADYLFVRAGNILLDRVTWQLGTLEDRWNDLHIYDQRPGTLLWDTVGLSGTYQGDRYDVLLAVGDSGYTLRPNNYNTVLTGAASFRYRLIPGHLEVGIRGQVGYEPAVRGNRNALYASPGTSYENFARREVVRRYFEANPGAEDLVPDLKARSALSYRAMGYVGFGGVGPLVWSNLYLTFEKRHPQPFYTENFRGRDWTVYVTDQTDERYDGNLGNEAYLRIIPDKLEALWGVWAGYSFNKDNKIAAGEDNRVIASTVLRLQYFLTDKVHLLVESSVAREKSLNGNLYRNHVDSVFTSTDGMADARGLEFGDSDTRDTWQFKAGVVLNPTGRSIYARPSLRLLYGLQRSTQHAAFGNSFVDSLDQYNVYVGPERHWHSVVAIEAEGWF